MEEELKLQEVHYFREVKPPTLKQFVFRRAVQEAMSNIKNVDGIALNPETGHPVPASALAAKQALKGLTSDKILRMHPEWENDFKEKYGHQSD